MRAFIRYANNFFALQVAGLVHLLAGKDAARKTWERYKL